MAATPGRIVVVHHESDARRIVRAMRSLRPCDAVTSLGELAAHLAHGPRVCGVLTAAHLEDGDGICAVDAVRGVAGNLPALLLVESSSTSILVAAYERRIALLPTSASERHLRTFAIDCIVADAEPDEAVRAALLETSTRYRLTAAEIEIVHGALHGRRSDWFVHERIVSVAAYKARVASVLRKTMADDVDALVREIFWLALQRDAHGAVA